MKRIVLVYGGNSLESEISILTALKVYKELSKVNKNVSLVYLDHQGNFYSSKHLVDLENYSIKKGFKKINFFKDKNKYFFKSKFKKTFFDLVLILGHGKNIEDGTLSSYFETLNIPYCYDDLSNVSLLQDKSKTKLVFTSLNIPQINYQIIHKFEYEKNKNFYLKLKFPLIIKPSRLGSSIGISKVHSVKELHNELVNAFRYDETIVLEECIEEKIEYNIALLGYENSIIPSEIEEVNHSKEVLSFFDKYDYSNGIEKRMICPLISKEIKNKIVDTSKEEFSKLNLCGIYRFDFIYSVKDNEIYLNEVNSLPGSLAYYLFEPKGINMADLVLMYIDFNLRKNKNRSLLLNTYQDGFASKVDLDKLKK